MESRYGIGINNRYGAFLDLEDGEELIMPKKKPMEAKTAPETTTTTAKQPVKKVDSVDKKDKPAAQSNSRPTKESAAKPNSREGKPSIFGLQRPTRKSTATSQFTSRSSCYTCGRLMGWTPSRGRVAIGFRRLPIGHAVRPANSLRVDSFTALVEMSLS